MKNAHTYLTLIITFVLGNLSLSAQVAPAIADAADNTDGTYTNWFGTYSFESGTLQSEGWINHSEHGRLYLAAQGENLWAYDPNVAALGGTFSGWIYSNRTIFPYILVNLDPITYLQFVPGATGPEGTPRVFVNPATFGNIYLPKVTTHTVVDIAIGNDAFSTLVTAVVTADLAGALSGEGPFTVFAPTNEAFAKLDPALLTDLTTNPESLPTLTSILTYHVVPGRLTSGQLGLDLGSILGGEVISGFVQTLGGADLRLDVTPFGLLLNGTTMVTAADIEASNGVIHVIDSVLLPPANIVDTAIANESFSTLVTAVVTADLAGALAGEGPFTVFAPTNEAFAALASTLELSLEDILALENLSNILTYHVFPGKVYASEVSPGEITMLNGGTATLSIDEDGNLMIDGAKIIATDIVTSNGVIHVIDAVILP